MFDDIDNAPIESEVTHVTDFIEFRAFLDPDACFTKSGFESACRISRERSSVKWREAVNLARSRVGYFKEAYCFDVPDDENDVLLLKEGTRDVRQEHYLFMLVCSSLKYFDRNYRNKLARDFENISRAAFRYMLPAGSTVKASWANPDANDSECYSGPLPEKLRSIARDIRCSTDHGIKDAGYSPFDTGDGGFDIVAWHDMYDSRPGIPIAVGQCSCAKTEWRLKQVEANYGRHQSKFPLMHGWSNYYFCPLDLWRSEKNWRHENNLGGAIVVDRARLVRFLCENNEPSMADVLSEIQDEADALA